MDREALKAIVREAVTRRLRGELADAGAGPAADSTAAGQGGRPLLVERDVIAARGRQRELRLLPGTLVTPLARETAERYGIALVDGAASEATAGSAAAAATPDPARPSAARSAGPTAEATPASAADPAGIVALGADHGGFALKQALKAFLEGEAGYAVLDFGTHGKDPVDYPTFAHRVAGAVARGEAFRGILVDGVGVGSAMAANRHRGVRAAAASGILEVVNAREHNDANVLCLGGRLVGDLLARALAMVFLTTEFAGGRHARRVAAIEEV